ncbi:MAG: DUF2867 domain-containing protein [Sideroxydans sp.]|nr:DUF2867 domain-containing protein [Sideroxydans sp.]
MNPNITPIAVPASSDISAQLRGADFFDCYEMPLAHAGRSALEIYLEVIGRTPAWIDFLMAMRNRVVRLFGLKNLGALGELKKTKAASEYRVGDRIGIFSLLSLADNEIIMGDADKHLEVKVSVCKLAVDGKESIATTTVVHIHNLLGRVYMFFVVPFHRRIVPAMLARASL